MTDMSVWPTDGADGAVSSEARWRKMGRLWVPSGVRLPTDLTPTLVAGPGVQVAAGQCWIDGHYAELTAPATVPVPASANGLVCARFTPADNHAQILYRDGATTLTQTDPTFEIPIAQMVAGAMRDIRWFAFDGSIGAAVNPAVVTITSAHTQASPADVVNLGWAYCDGGPLIFEFSAMIFGNVVPATGYMYCRLWDNAAEATADRPCGVAYGSTYGPCHNRVRYTPPAAGVHQFRARAYGTAGVTSGNSYGPSNLRAYRA